MRLEPQDWERLAGGGQLPATLAVGALLDLNDQVESLQRQLEDLANAVSSTQKFDLRAEALKAAREHVSALPSEQRNERGYRDHALRADERITQELQVARYLLMEDR